MGLFIPVQLLEPLAHGGVVFRQLFDGEVLGLVVGQAELAVGGSQGFLDLLQVGNGLVDLVDGFAEALAGLGVVIGELFLEVGNGARYRASGRA